MENTNETDTDTKQAAQPGSRSLWTAIGLLVSGATGVGVGYLIAKPKNKPPCACKVGNGNGNGNGNEKNG
ncbi:MAG: hypothetical protein IPK80_16090 [Nannocystis sp.]|nr:hypothetical protein [Nannocystis sp.]